ncbi:MAG: cell division protein FtsZ [Gemmatimonadota bacterium]|nr:cell division protein FtsZ [Gemmatimonadota bacterium]
MIFELEDGGRNSALMKVIGVGGAGGNAVNRMILEDLEGVDFISANTDAQALETSRAPTTIQLGKRLTRGLGAGARPEVGRQAIAEDADEVRQSLLGADLVFIAAGMGGGTGTGAAPIIGEIAKELGALAIAIVTRPFSFEGGKRMKQAEQGLAELRRTVDTMIVVPNDRLLSVVGKGTSFRDALKKADEVLLNATQGISDLIRVSGDVNVDFADVRTIMSCRGPALMGSGVGRGETRAVDAAQEAVASPLLDNISIRGATGVLINITGGMDLAIDEVTEISTMIQQEAGDEAEIIFGAVHDPSMEEEVRVTLIATGFETESERSGRVLRPTFPPKTVEVPAVAQRQSPVAAAGGGAVTRRAPFGGIPLDRVASRGSAPETPNEAVPFQVDPELELPTFISRRGS